MIVESSRDGAASSRPYFNSESIKHGLNASGILLMHFDFAPQYQKLPLGVLLYALLDSFQSLAAPPRFSSTHKEDDDFQASTITRVDAPSVPIHALDSVWLECGLSPRHHGIVVESQSAALGTALTTPHEGFWPRTTSSRLHKPRACRVCPRLPRRVALQNAGVRASRRSSHIDSSSKLRRTR